MGKDTSLEEILVPQSRERINSEELDCHFRVAANRTGNTEVAKHAIIGDKRSNDRLSINSLVASL
jgi:hypothetical protein